MHDDIRDAQAGVAEDIEERRIDEAGLDRANIDDLIARKIVSTDGQS